MDYQEFVNLFTLFKSAYEATVEQLLPTAIIHQYPQERALLMEDSWGNAVYFIVSGWVKIRRINIDQTMTISILGPGDFFGEMAILDESPRSTDVVAISEVQVITIPAQTFITALKQDNALQYRMLQLMVKRVRATNQQLELNAQPPAIKLIKILVDLALTYGDRRTETITIPLLEGQDWADLAKIEVNSVSLLLGKLEEKQWIKLDRPQQLLTVLDLKKMQRLLKRKI